MPEFDSDTQDKIDDLRELSNNFSEDIEVYQLVRVGWGGDDGPIWYTSALAGDTEDNLPDEVDGPIQIRLPADSYPEYFLPTTSDSTMGDSEVNLKIWDGDDEISRLVDENGEGVSVGLYFWFPAVELLLLDWQGYLRTSEDSDVEFWLGKAANGFRSPNLPMPRRAHYQSCQEVFGQGGCIYNRHLGGDIGNLNGGVPFTSCPKKTFQQCIDRIGDKLSHLSHQSVSEAIVNNQTKGPNLLATSAGNETNLKDPVRVIMGVRYVRQLALMLSTPQYNNNHPEKGFWRCKFEIGEGPIAGCYNAFVKGQNCQTSSNAASYVLRGGEIRQPPTDFSPNVHNYSCTAHFDYTYGWVDPSQTPATDLPAEAHIDGLVDIKQYSDENTFITGSTRNRAWQLLRMLTDRRWGYGLDVSRISIPSFIELAAWASTQVDFTEPATGNVLRHERSMCDLDLQSRTTQQQVEDVCWAGRFSRPFLFQNQIHVIPLKDLDFDELEAAPLFTDSDEFGTPNIVFENNKTTLRHSRISDEDLPNRIELTYDQGPNLNLENVIPVEDEDLQLRAGALLGDTTRRIVSKQESALGTTDDEQATKLAWTVLDLGKFDEGGLQNNLEIKYKAWFLDCLSLHPYKPIHVLSAKITRYGFEWFRIKKIERLSNLQVQITAQAYAREYMDNLEEEVFDPAPDYVPGTYQEVIPLQFGDIGYSNGYLEVEIIAGS